MLALLGAGWVLSLAGCSVPRRAARPASLRLAASHRCGWPVATEAAGELRLADDPGDGSGPGDDVYEVVIARPVGMQLMERPGSGVAVSMVYEAGNAANEGVRVGDVVLATSASIGPQMWEKSTVAGVESAIRTRVDGKIRLRFRRGTQRPPTWDAPLQWTYDVELGRPLGGMVKVLLWQPPQLGSSGRAWWLWAARTPKGKPGRRAPSTASAARASRLQSRRFDRLRPPLPAQARARAARSREIRPGRGDRGGRGGRGQQRGRRRPRPCGRPAARYLRLLRRAGDAALLSRQAPKAAEPRLG